MRTSLVRWLRLLAVAFALSLPLLAAAQSGGPSFPKEQLDQLTAPIALYPDALLSQVLMASTYPDEVAKAAAWSRAHSDQKGDDAVKQVQNQPWDPSVQSLVAFPQVVIMMGEKPDWVRDLGDAFLAQPDDVMASVQRLRAQAQKAGNLSSNKEVKVSSETVTVEQTGAPEKVIVIQPASPEVVYVPTYNPTVVYGAWPYPAYPPYYIPPPPGYWFSAAVATGIAWGVGIGISNALWGGCNWGRGDVNINVNRYNNINVNNRINNSNWNHNVQNRGNVPYRGGDVTRQQLDRKYQAAQRDQFRGRDAERERARQSMERSGVTPDRSAVGNRGQGMDRGMGTPRSTAQDRDNAFRGAGSSNAMAEANRGASSRQAMQRDMPRASSGGASARPQAAPRDGGGMRAGGGGGGARAAGGGGRAGGGGGGGGGRGGGGRR